MYVTIYPDLAIQKKVQSINYNGTMEKEMHVAYLHKKDRSPLMTPHQLSYFSYHKPLRIVFFGTPRKRKDKRKKDMIALQILHNTAQCYNCVILHAQPCYFASIPSSHTCCNPVSLTWQPCCSPVDLYLP